MSSRKPSKPLKARPDFIVRAVYPDSKEDVRSAHECLVQSYSDPWPQSQSSLRKRISTQDVTALIASRDDGPVCSCLVYQIGTGRRHRILSIGTLLDARELGYATALIEHLQTLLMIGWVPGDAGSGLGMKTPEITGLVEAENEPAEKLLAGTGFRPWRKIAGYFEGQEGDSRGVNAVVYRWVPDPLQRLAAARGPGKR